MNSEAYNTAAAGRETLNNAIKNGLEEKLPGLKIKDIRHSNANINRAKQLLGYHTLEEGIY